MKGVTMNNKELNSKTFTNVDELYQTIEGNEFQANNSHKPLKLTCQMQMLYVRQIIKHLEWL